MADIDLVIKIPENTYKQIQALVRNEYFEHDICGNSMRRIANGTPLPKGHGDLIDRNKLEPDTEYDGYYDSLISYSEMQIRNAVTIVEADETESEG